AILLDSGVHSAVVMSNDFDDPGTAVTDNTAGSAELEIDLATGGPADLPAAPDLTSAALPVDRFPDPGTDTVVVVTDHGAHGNGAHDDTSAFRDALQAAGEAGGGTVY